MNGAYFFVSTERQEEIRSSLITNAIANARSRADKAAEAVNIEITGVKSINPERRVLPDLLQGICAGRWNINPNTTGPARDFDDRAGYFPDELNRLLSLPSF